MVYTYFFVKVNLISPKISLTLFKKNSVRDFADIFGLGEKIKK